jgi:hypothetical protein
VYVPVSVSVYVSVYVSVSLRGHDRDACFAMKALEENQHERATLFDSEEKCNSLTVGEIESFNVYVVGCISRSSFIRGCTLINDRHIPRWHFT